MSVQFKFVTAKRDKIDGEVNSLLAQGWNVHGGVVPLTGGEVGVPMVSDPAGTGFRPISHQEAAETTSAAANVVEAEEAAAEDVAAMGAAETQAETQAGTQAEQMHHAPEQAMEQAQAPAQDGVQTLAANPAETPTAPDAAPQAPQTAVPQVDDVTAESFRNSFQTYMNEGHPAETAYSMYVGEIMKKDPINWGDKERVETFLTSCGISPQGLVAR